MLQRHLTGLALAFGIIVVPALASAASPERTLY